MRPGEGPATQGSVSNQSAGPEGVNFGRNLHITELPKLVIVSLSASPASAMLLEFLSDAAAGKNSPRPGPKTVPSIACESLSMMKNIVQRSDAVALLTLNLLLPDLETRAIAVLPLVLPVLRGEFCIVQLARRNLSPMGEMFVRTLLEVDAEVAQLEQLAARILFPAKQRRARDVSQLKRAKSKA